MQTRIKFAQAVGGLGVILASAVGCEVTKTETARAPDVDVDVQPGRWPEYDIDWADVDVGTQQRTITVPTVRVVEESREITVPYIDINPPGARDRDERTITMELDVPHTGFELQIVEIRAARDDMWIVGRLTEGEAPSKRFVTRVSDQVVVHAPENLDVRKVIVGQRPDGVYNRQFRFVEDLGALERVIPAGGRVLYRR